MDPQVAAAIAPLPEGYADLLERLRRQVYDDPRVRAMWLAGSLGRGVADAGSDLDLVMTVSEVEPFHDPAVWDVVDPVITTPIPGMPGCFAFTTRAGLRVDIVLETPTDLERTAYRHRVRVLDRDGLSVPDPEPDKRGPDVERMQAIVTELLRQSAIYPYAVVARQDWLLGQMAVHHYRTLLYELFVEANQPLPVMGVKQWSAKLTPDQRRLLESIPGADATPQSVDAVMRAVRDAWRTEGRAALEQVGGTWPVEVDEALDALWRQ